ncbi:MAG: type III-B CRISPR module RAMP protein Cmr4 [Brockia lithotrophica]|nr:type III-B CRISPR module RAMP protein Cmr4 [Brockia lithotrophica]
MYQRVKPFLLQAVTSLHPGSGSDVGVVDLPVQRERHTQFPKIEASSLKGAIRSAAQWRPLPEDEAEDVHRCRMTLLFGSDPEEARKPGRTTQASAIALSDARLLFFPVRSLKGVFAWVTAPMVVRRFKREMILYRPAGWEELAERLPIPAPGTTASPFLWLNEKPATEDRASGTVVLEEYTFSVKVDESARTLARMFDRVLFGAVSGSAEGLEARLVVLDDDAFRDFVLLSTEVQPRIAIDPNTGTVAGKALWYEEHLPPETIFYGFLLVGNVREGAAACRERTGIRTADDVLQWMTDERYFPSVFQLGGDATVGKGFVERFWLEPELFQDIIGGEAR